MAEVTEKYINDLVADRKQYYNGLHKEIGTNRDLRYGEYKIEVPENYKSTTQVIRTPIVADMIMRIVSMLTLEEPERKCAPYNGTEKAQRNSSLRERWTKAAWRRMEAQSGRPIWRMAMDAAVADGLGVIKVIHDKDAWLDYPKRKRREDGGDYNDRADAWKKTAPFPIFATDLDPLCYFPSKNGYKLTEVVEINKRPLKPAMQAFNVKPLGDNGWQKMEPGEPFPDDESLGHLAESVEVVEYWNDKEVVYLLDGKIADRRPHYYGRPPYFEVPGHISSSRDPRKAYLSVIEPFKHLIPALETLLTMKTNWAYLAAWPNMVVQNQSAFLNALPEDDNEPTKVLDISPGTILRGDIRFMEPPGVGRDLDAMIDILRAMIERAGLAAVMYGQSGSSASGYLTNQLMTAAQLIYRPLLRNAETADEDMTRHIWRILEKYYPKDPVFVWGSEDRVGKSQSWLSMSGSDVNGYYAVETRIKPVLPMDEIMQADAATRWVSQGMVSKKYALEKYFNVPAPEEMADEIAVEQYLMMPEVARRIAEDAARKAGVLQEQPQAPQMPGAPGGGGISPTPMPPMIPSGPEVPGNTMPMVPRSPGGNIIDPSTVAL